MRTFLLQLSILFFLQPDLLAGGGGGGGGSAIVDCAHPANLVPNCSFESYSTCPNSSAQLESRCNNWINPMNVTSPDYFNSCFTTPCYWGTPCNYYGTEDPALGNAYAGALHKHVSSSASGWREYVQAQLTSPLTAGTTYNVSWYTSLAENYSTQSSYHGMYFSVGATLDTFTTYIPMPVSPQVQWTGGNIGVSTGWQRITGTYTASGGENHITIGDFFNGPSGTGSYYFIDLVCVAPVSSGACGGALPITLNAFGVKPGDDGRVRVAWSTSSESNSDYYLVQRSEDNESFETIGQVKGAGNSSRVINYEFYDENPSPDIAYYRLKHVDYNGQHSYSKVVHLDLRFQGKPVLYDAAFANGSLVLRFSGNGPETVQVEVYNLLGERILAAKPVTSNGICRTDVSGLEKGMYLVSVSYDGITTSVKAVK